MWFHITKRETYLNRTMLLFIIWVMDQKEKAALIRAALNGSCDGEITSYHSSMRCRRHDRHLRYAVPA